MRQQVQRPGDGTVKIFLSAAVGDWWTPVEPMNLTARGAQFRQDPSHPTPAPVGGELTVWLCEESTGIELPITAKLVHRREEDDGRVLGVDFVDLRSVGGLLHPVLGRAMNRRAAFRVTPNPHHAPIHVTLGAPPELDLPLEIGTLIDISTGGLAIDVPPSFERALGSYDRLECLFQLPGVPESLAVTVQVVHRTLKADHIRYGVRFAHAESPAFRHTHDAILGYVIRRQQQMAEEHELLHGTGIPAQALSRPH